MEQQQQHHEHQQQLSRRSSRRDGRRNRNPLRSSASSGNFDVDARSRLAHRTGVQQVLRDEVEEIYAIPTQCARFGRAMRGHHA